MQAIVINQFGDSSVFTKTELEAPAITRNEVLIEVMASSVNSVDWKIRKGLAPPLCPVLPAVLHGDCAGIVTSVGNDVSDFVIGDEVYAFASGLAGKQGALAQFMPADARMVAKKPTNLSFIEAASLPLVAVTSWLAMVDRLRIEPDSNILIQGGTGGVGSFALQLARSKFGNNVYASCGSHDKCEIAQELGAKQAFNYKTQSVQDIAQSVPGGSFDVIFNTAGAGAINDATQMAAFNGAILDINGTFPTEGPFQLKGLGFLSVFGGYPITHGFDQQRVGRILREVAQLAETGDIRAQMDPKVFNFSDVGSAHDYLEAGSAVGKVGLKADF